MHGSITDTQEMEPMANGDQDQPKDGPAVEILREDLSTKALIYKVKENPPFHITVFCALQVSLYSCTYKIRRPRIMCP